ncbi:Hypothetical predicted protein [Lecanosticta acicola]|uniref:Uncharacterized protein n=1 Tax=Lecanosticta acicola TaxID=111012 RepID=A0AAI8Z9F7_9PEZI|nr:Hypothetical predicted protein [Lecanosticta acicola]
MANPRFKLVNGPLSLARGPDAQLSDDTLLNLLEAVERELEAPPPSGDDEDDGIPALPSWFNEVHSSDLVGETKRVPSIVAVEVKDNKWQYFGSLAGNSGIRISFKNISQLPSIGINARQNHLQGDQKENRKNEAKTSSGKDGKAFVETYKEEDFEIDLDHVSFMETGNLQAPFHDGDLEAALARTGCRMDGIKTIGKICFRIEEDRHLMRIQTVASGGDFDTSTPEAEFRDISWQLGGRVVICFFPVDQSYQRRAFEGFQTIVAARSCTPSRRSTDEFFLHRHDVTYHQLVSEPDRRLVKEPWLTTANGGKEAYNPIYATRELNAVPKMRFGSAGSFKRVYLRALLNERDYTAQLQKEQCSTSKRHRATIDRIDGIVYGINIMLGGDDAAAVGGTRILPIPGTTVEVTLLPTEEELRGRETEDVDIECTLKDEVQYPQFTPRGYDFRIVAKLPEFLQANQDLLRIGVRQSVIVLWKHHDEDSRRKMRTVNAVAQRLDVDLKTSVRLKYARNRKEYFEYVNVIADHFAPLPGVNLWTLCRDLFHSSDLNKTGALLTKLATLPDKYGLDNDQKRAWDLAMNGTTANIFLIEGYPGTGKTTILKMIIITLLLMGYRVAIVCQSNAAVDALMDKVCQAIFGHDKILADMLPEMEILRDKLVRISSSAREGARLHELHRLYQQPSNLPAEDTSLAACVLRYFRAHQKEPLCVALHGHLKAYADKNIVPRKAFAATVKALRSRILAQSLLVACTCHGSTDILSDMGEAGFQADVLVLDEAGQATEPDFLEPVVTFPRLRRVILSGDIKQLGPVLLSRTADQNPWADVLATSPLLRITKAYPNVAVVELRQNHRAHPLLIELPSALFYEGKMMGDARLRVQTALASNVLALIRSAVFQAAIKKSGNADSRQYFVDIQTPSQQEQHGTSTFNPGGAAFVVRLISKLITKAKVTPKDIGIVSMYKADVRHLTDKLADQGLGEVDVLSADKMDLSTVDKYQGREKKIMVVHLVAAWPDRRAPFGLVRDARRMNVALTRAQDFQFVVGNLSLWKVWLDKYAGRSPPSGDRKIGEMIQWIYENGPVVDGDRLMKS